MLSLNRYRLRHQAQQGVKAAQRSHRLLARTDRLLGTILVGNNFVNILASSLATVLAMELWGDAGIAIATVGMTLALLLFGEITPKTFAAMYPERVAYPLSGLLGVMQRILAPVVILLSAISNGLLRLLGIDPNRPHNHNLSSEELRTLVTDSGGALPANRKSMLLGILDLERVTVDDIMIPRNEVFGIDLDDDMPAIIEFLRTNTYTRLPLYRGDLNQIQGMLHMRQLAGLLIHDQLTHEHLIALANEPYFVPEGTPLSTQLLNFQKEKRRIGIVVDEYGDVQGLVTLEDILEEIVGEFSLHDALKESEIHPQEDGTFHIEGTAYVREVNRHLGWELPEDGPKTMNGLVTELLEQIPSSPCCIQIGPYRLEIEQAAKNRVVLLSAWATDDPRTQDRH